MNTTTLIPNRYAESWRDQLHRYGLFETLLGKVLNRLKPTLTVMWVSSARFADRKPSESKIDSESRVLNEQEMRSLPVYMPDQITADFVEAAIQRGDICVGTFVDEQLIGMSWRSYTTAPHQHGLWVKFKKPYRYGYKSYVLPQFRGLRAVTPGVSDAHCLTQGCDRTISFVERHNLPSMKNIRRRGTSRFLGHILILRLFDKTFILSTPGVKATGFAFYTP